MTTATRPARTGGTGTIIRKVMAMTMTAGTAIRRPTIGGTAMGMVTTTGTTMGTVVAAASGSRSG